MRYVCLSAVLLFACNGTDETADTGSSSSKNSSNTEQSTLASSWEQTFGSSITTVSETPSTLVGTGSTPLTEESTPETTPNTTAPTPTKSPSASILADKLVCDPGASEVQWVEEGEYLEVPIECLTGEHRDTTDFELDNLPEGASYDNGKLIWTTDLDHAGVYYVDVIDKVTGETGDIQIGVADAYDDSDNESIEDEENYSHELGLPVLHLHTDQDLNNEGYTPAEVTYGGHTYTAEAKLRGASSLRYPKNSYTLKFEKEDKFSAHNQIDPYSGSFLEKRKIVLTSTFDDNSYIRQRLSFSMWNMLDDDHIQVDSFNVVVYLDGEYWGMYLLGDHIDEYLMEDHGLDQEGNLFKARHHDANFRTVDKQGEPKSVIHQGLTKSEGSPEQGEPGAFDDLDDFIDFVATSTDDQLIDDFGDIATQSDYENWWIFVATIAAHDSAGKNSYHYHDPNGGPWRVIPWDFNDSFGQDWQTRRVEANEPLDDYTRRNNLFTRWLSHDEAGPALRARLVAALDDQYSLDEVLDLVDQWEEENKLSAERDEDRWGDEYRNFGWKWRSYFISHEQEVDYVRTWIVNRWDYLRDEL